MTPMEMTEGWDSQAPSQGYEGEVHRKQSPTGIILGVAAVLVLIGLALQEFASPDLAQGIFGFAAAVLGVMVLLDPLAGLGLYVFAVAISPEFTLAGIENLRAEDFVLVVLLISRLLQALRQSRGPGRFELLWPIGLLLFLSLVSTLNNAIIKGLDVVASLVFLAKTCTYYIVAILAYDLVRTRRDVKILLVLIGLSGLSAAVWALAYHDPMKSIHDLGGRIMGPEGETGNIFAAYLVVNTIIIIAICLESHVAWHPWLGIPIFVVMSIPTLYTFSRAGFVSLVVGFGLMAVAFHRRLLVGLLVFAVVFTFMAPDPMTERISTIGTVVTDEPTSSWAHKMIMWGRAYETFIANPLIGAGINKIPLGGLDNEFVKQAHDLGILGIIVFLWLLFVILRQTLRLVRQAGDPLYRGLAIGFLCAFAAMIVNAISAPTFTAIRTGELFFLLTGLVFAVSRMTGCDQEGYLHQGGYREIPPAMDEYEYGEPVSRGAPW